MQSDVAMVVHVNGGHAMMEDVSSAQNHSGQLGPPGGSMGMGGKMNADDQTQRPQYSIPGILHFIQHEWARFEMERAQWDVERAEFQARIAFLQGERKGQENLKNDLIRRIKMLEFALKQERIKAHKLKYDSDPNPTELKAPVFDDINKDEPMDGEMFITSNSNVSWRQGRQLLRQYLQEIGYTDTILDVRSARVRTLLGLGPANTGSGQTEEKSPHPTVNGGGSGTPGEPVKRPSDTQRRVPGKKMANVAENTLLDAEASVLATFDFLATENVDMDDEEDNFSDEMEDAVSADDEAEERMDNRRIKSKTLGAGDDLGDADSESVLTEFDFLGPDSGEGGREARSQGDGSDWGKRPFFPLASALSNLPSSQCHLALRCSRSSLLDRECLSLARHVECIESSITTRLGLGTDRARLHASTLSNLAGEMRTGRMHVTKADSGCHDPCSFELMRVTLAGLSCDNADRAATLDVGRFSNFRTPKYEIFRTLRVFDCSQAQAEHQCGACVQSVSRIRPAHKWGNPLDCVTPVIPTTSSASFPKKGMSLNGGGCGGNTDGSEEDEEEEEEMTGEQWGADPQLISQLVEEYRRERKGRKGAPSQSESSPLPPSLFPPSPMSLSFSFLEGRPSSSPSASSSSSSFTSGSGDSMLNGSGQPQQGTRLGYAPFLEEAEDNGSSCSSPQVETGITLSPPRPRRPLMGAPGVDEDNIDAALGLGELAGLTVNNEAESSYDISATKESFRKTWNAKYTLRSHFDGVRALAFHPVEPVLITASEDHTLKLWNLQKTVPAKKTAALDVEPVYTFRGHAGPVLCLAMSATGEQCFSGGLDHTIRCWNVPSSAIDPYDAFEPGVLSATLWGHTDAVWSLSMHAAKLQLLSCSGDGTVRLWSPHSKVPLLHTYTAPETGGCARTSGDRRRGVRMGTRATYTLETSSPRLTRSRLTRSRLTRSRLTYTLETYTCHAYAANEVVMFVLAVPPCAGKMVHSMVAHLDAVTSLAIDPNGLYLLSGSHDCSIRLWNLDNKTCVQEITSHRKKFDESIFDVAFHPSKPYIASAGADALAKVFV
ncbi:unnamed protein product [Ixodes hexagonus]